MTRNGAASRPLKAQNTWKLAGFVVANAVVFYSVVTLGQWNASSIVDGLLKVDPGNAALSVVLPVAVIILNGLISSEGKARLVFWRMKDPLPGSRAFSVLAQRDPRIDIDALRKKYGQLPSVPREQNVQWYKLFRKLDSKANVISAHQDYLLARDVTVLAFLFFITLGIGALVLPISGLTKLGYILATLVSYLIARQSAKNYGERLVCTVLAEAETD